MYGDRLFDPKDIPSDLLDCFEEVETICGAPWERVVEKPKPPKGVYTGTQKPDDIAPISHPDLGKVGMGQKRQDWYEEHPLITLGWRPTCTCGEQGIIPATVLDPFSGTGTTGVVALRHGRSYIGIDLSPTYHEMALKQLTMENALKPIDGKGIEVSDLPLFARKEVDT